MSIARMVLNDLTCIDHAYINDKGDIVGGSFHYSVIVTGKIDKKEQVVEDFSSIKKRIKEKIDHPETGYDHKLWFINGYSNAVIEYQGNQVTIKTPKWILTGPDNMLRGFNAEDEFIINTYNESNIEHEISSYLEANFPELEFTSKVSIDVHSYCSDTTPYMFRYVHGLKFSTSWGCQNIAHGHTSYITGIPMDHSVNDVLDFNRELQQMAAWLDGAIFVHDENWDELTNTISYETPRGKFTMQSLDVENSKIFVYPHETTIENLTRTIAGNANHIDYYLLEVSEGLSKGSIVYKRDLE